MPRKGENIYKRKDGRWEGRILVGHDDSGKAVYRSVYPHTYRDVRDKMKTAPHTVTRPSTDVTVYGYIDKYLESPKPTLKLGTVKIYERYMQSYIKPQLENVRLDRLTTEHLQTFVNSLSLLAPSTIKSIFSFVREGLKQAYKQNEIDAV